MGIIWFLLIGMLAGWLAGQLTKGSGFGALNNMIIGVLGAVVGGFLFRLLGLGATNSIGSVITSTIGAIVVLFVLSRYGRKL